MPGYMRRDIWWMLVILAILPTILQAVTQNCYYTLNEEGEIYLDGVQAGSLTSKWLLGIVAVPPETRVIAIHAYNTLGGWQIRASIGDVVTDLSSWRCTGTYHAGWADPGYDDSGWPLPVDGTDSWTHASIDGAAIDIWAAGSPDNAYCRRRLIQETTGSDLEITTTEMMETTELLTTTQSSEPCISDTDKPFSLENYFITNQRLLKVSQSVLNVKSLLDCASKVNQGTETCDLTGFVYNKLTKTCQAVLAEFAPNGEQTDFSSDSKVKVYFKRN